MDDERATSEEVWVRGEALVRGTDLRRVRADVEQARDNRVLGHHRRCLPVLLLHRAEAPRVLREAPEALYVPLLPGRARGRRRRGRPAPEDREWDQTARGDRTVAQDAHHRHRDRDRALDRVSARLAPAGRVHRSGTVLVYIFLFSITNWYEMHYWYRTREDSGGRRQLRVKLGVMKELKAAAC